MGNVESSGGLLVGSVLGGLIFAPFTGGTSLMMVAAASGTGTVVGFTATTVNMLQDRRAPEDDRMKHFLIGAGSGFVGPACGAAAKVGAEVTIGVEVAAIGIGATTAGDGKPKLYAGNRDEAVKHYHQSTTLYHHVPPSRPTEQRIMTYRFVTTNSMPKNAFMTLKNEYRCYPDDPMVERVYVIRRKLDTLPVYIGWMAHSGLLLKTSNGRWFVCEYGTEADKNNVSLYEVSSSIPKNPSSSFEHAGRTWDKQICGSSLDVRASIRSVKETMATQVGKRTYGMIFWNCHMAQERTRKALGLKVSDEYLSDKHREELLLWNAVN